MKTNPTGPMVPNAYLYFWYFPSRRGRGSCNLTFQSSFWLLCGYQCAPQAKYENLSGLSFFPEEIVFSLLSQPDTMEEKGDLIQPPQCRFSRTALRSLYSIQSPASVTTTLKTTSTSLLQAPDSFFQIPPSEKLSVQKASCEVWIYYGYITLFYYLFKKKQIPDIRLFYPYLFQFVLPSTDNHMLT